ncbi:MAG: AI-2E family transporter [Eubacteriales bacterium]|nr:AI-2E family transporter [Eubacteriales bacterium]
MGNLLGKNGKKTLILAGFAILLFLVFKYLFPLTAPFLLAFLIVYLCNPWLKKVQQKTHIKKEILLGGILLLGAVLIVMGVWSVISWGSVHAADIGDGMLMIQERMNGVLHDGCLLLEEKFGMNAAQAEEQILAKMADLAENAHADALPEAAKQSWEYLKSIAGAGAFLGIGFISTVLLCKDYESILAKMGENQISDEIWKFVEKIISLIGGYLKAQVIILLAISLIAVTGLLIGRVGGAVWLGLLAGLLDALPFIGTGIVLVPTALWQLLSGNPAGAIMAAAAYVLCIVVRELLEPRLLGKQVGMYPVVMLLAVYAGVRLFGLAGIFLGPLYMVLFREGIRLAARL